MKNQNKNTANIEITTDISINYKLARINLTFNNPEQEALFNELLSKNFVIGVDIKTSQNSIYLSSSD